MKKKIILISDWLSGSEEGDSGLSQWRQGDISVQLCSWEQQWNKCGGWSDSRDNILYLGEGGDDNLHVTIICIYICEHIYICTLRTRALYNVE